MTIVLCFSGGIASGKTSVATAVAEQLGCESASFGRYVRAIAQDRGIEENREKLQALGESLITDMGWTGFCRAVLEAAGWQTGSSIIVDGIRHVRALETIRDVVAPMPTKLIFVDAPQNVRQARAEGREETTDLTKVDHHSTERDVHQALKAMADLVVDGTRSLPSVIEEVACAVADWSTNAPAQR